ncbi:MAG: hypothetical protein U0169_08150 [Polyangiaceae bacterium]
MRRHVLRQRVLLQRALRVGEHLRRVRFPRRTCTACGATQTCSLGACVTAACPVGKVACATGCCAPILAVAETSACAMDRGALVCWGSNTYEQLGTPGVASNPGPVFVSDATFGVKALAGGQYSNCLLTNAGGVKCWGDNSLGQSGSNSFASTTGLEDVVGLASGVTDIAGTTRHFCAILAGGSVKCWGGGTSGRLGNGSTSESRVPVDVLSLGGSRSRSRPEKCTPAPSSPRVRLKVLGLQRRWRVGNGVHVRFAPSRRRLSAWAKE